MKDEGGRMKKVHSLSFRLLPFSSDEMNPAARWRRRLIFAREPFHFFARAVASDVEFRASHILELDFDRVAGIQRHQSFVESSRRNDVARTEPKKLCQPSDLVGYLMRHGASIVILPRLAAVPGFHDDVVRIGDFVFGDDPWPAAAVGALALADKLRAPHKTARRDIEDRYIAENIIERFVRGNVLRGLTHDKGKLGFGLINDASRNVAQLDTLAGSHQIR